MKIKTLSASGLKGRSFTHTIAPVTYIHARNFAGKSSRLEALQLALTGSVPGVPNNGPGIWQLASGNPLRVSIETDAGVTERTWTEVKGKITYHGSDGSLVPNVLVDLSEFTSLSGPERLKYLFRRTNLPAELGLKKVRDGIVANIKNIKLEENTEATEKACRELATWVSEHADARCNVPTQDWLEALRSDIADKAKLAKSNVTRMTQTAQGLVQVRNENPAPQDAEARYEQAKREYAEADKNHASITEKLTQARNAYRIAAELAKCAVDETEARAKLEELSKAKEALFKATMTSPPAPDSKPHSEAMKNQTAAEMALGKEEDAVARIRAALQTAEKNVCCEACGQELPKEKREPLIQKLTADLDARLKNLESIQKLVEVSNAIVTETRASFDEQIAAYNDHNNRTSAFRDLSQQHADLQAKLQASAAAQEAAAKLPELESQGRLLAVAQQTAFDDRAEKGKVMMASEVDYKRLLGERAESAAAAKAQEAQIAARADAGVLKEAVTVIADLQALLIEKCIEPLLATANRLCAPILPSPLAYNDGKLGFWRGSKFIEARQPFASGTESALSQAALCIALASESTCRLVILDEMGRLDAGNQAKLLDVLCQLEASGQIDQAIVLGPVAHEPCAENMKCIELV